ncbi:DUF4062 domain-containing protein [Neptunomonas sp. CHC150]|uniref:DUF4062 domain-containing protein n=1 Tax=Neptunomonas sp. CHC150 TaxID=2998324 RepID=UPI0025B24DF7|nr:DUF4062 domain-containing protein [Neptunomonas sp. CHC150]MDN2659422.1 DUF4062 domain-containing protein [Neptunomonas sp. CHC150]
MDKRYQIFISSTFVDLIDERQAVLKSILELDHMPAGMELFPATDDTAWDLIKDVIDASDYYVLIVGGRYGSLDSEGIGYTEKEYDYAVKTKKPVIPLLHQNPDNLPRDKTETDQEVWEKLKTFREKVEGKHTCVYWNSADELKAKVIIGLTSATKRHPAVGWVRADKVPSETTITEVLKLKQKVAELEAELIKNRNAPPPGTEDLMQGDDSFKMKVVFTGRRPGGDWSDDVKYQASISPTWNEIFAGVAPVLINEASESALRSAFDSYLTQVSRNEFEEHEDLKGHSLKSFSFSRSEIDTCMIQLRALGLIKESDKKRSVRDTATYWSLTSYGDQLMVQLRALSRNQQEARRIGSEATVAQDDE